MVIYYVRIYSIFFLFFFSFWCIISYSVTTHDRQVYRYTYCKCIINILQNVKNTYLRVFFYDIFHSARITIRQVGIYLYSYYYIIILVRDAFRTKCRILRNFITIGYNITYNIIMSSFFRKTQTAKGLYA